MSASPLVTSVVSLPESITILAGMMSAPGSPVEIPHRKMGRNPVGWEIRGPPASLVSVGVVVIRVLKAVRESVDCHGDEAGERVMT